MAKPTAELVEDHLIVWNPEEGEQLYRLGYYGKPLGVSKPHPGDFVNPVVLDLIEGLYLLEGKAIRVHGQDGKSVSKRMLLARARSVYQHFDYDYLVYRNLRERGKVVLPGIKFGCEFAVYDQGPGIDHAPYLISVRTGEECVTSADIVRAGRLATTVRKRFIVAVPDVKASLVQYLMFDWFRA